MKQKEKIESHYEDKGTSVRILGSMLTKTDGFVRHLDTQINILMGISSAIFVFSASQIKNSEWWMFLLVVSIFSAASSFISLLAIHPPRFLRKRNQMESLMYNKKIASLKSSKEYAKQLEDVFRDEKKIIEQFSIEMYNLCKYYYRPKRKLFNLSRNILISGIFISLIAFILDFIYIKF